MLRERKSQRMFSDVEPQAPLFCSAVTGEGTDAVVAACASAAGKSCDQAGTCARGHRDPRREAQAGWTPV